MKKFSVKICIMKKDEQLILEMKASELYFLKGYDQGKIGKVLGCSRATISRLLKKAIEDGIVEVRIKNPFNEAMEIEKALRKKYLLKKVIVVRGKYENSNLLRKAIGAAAAELASTILKTGDVVGISCGRTLYEMTNSLPRFSKKLDIEVIPLLGGLGMVQPEHQVNELSRMFAESFGGRSKVFDVPILISKKEMRDLLLEEKGVKEVIESWDRLDIVFVAIGSPASSSPILTTKYRSWEEIQQLIQLDAVGDICGRFFDKNGSECKVEANQRLISIDFERLKKVPLRVGIGGGKEKIAGIRGALLKGLINILVTDEETAKGILERSK